MNPAGWNGSFAKRSGDRLPGLLHRRPASAAASVPRREGTIDLVPCERRGVLNCRTDCDIHGRRPVRPARAARRRGTSAGFGRCPPAAPASSSSRGPSRRPRSRGRTRRKPGGAHHHQPGDGRVSGKHRSAGLIDRIIDPRRFVDHKLAIDDKPRMESVDPGRATTRLRQRKFEQVVGRQLLAGAIRLARTFRVTSADWRCVGAMASDVLPGRKIMVCAMAATGSG